jgi:hypothetical protein
MAIIAQWLSKQWEVTPQKIVALDALATSFKLIKDENEDAEGKPATKHRRLDLQPLTFETFLSDSVGIDVRAEIEEWSLLVGESSPFLLGGKRFGPEKLLLTDVSVSDIIIDDLGRFRQARVSTSFTEDAPEAAKNKQKSQPASGSSAVGVGATTKDKAEKKPSAIAQRWQDYTAGGDRQ